MSVFLILGFAAAIFALLCSSPDPKKSSSWQTFFWFLVGVFAIMYLSTTEAHAEDGDWTGRSIQRNARVFAKTGNINSCLFVGKIDSALAYCQALVKQDVTLCDKVSNPEAQQLCVQELTPKPSR